MGFYREMENIFYNERLDSINNICGFACICGFLFITYTFRLLPFPT
uniref:ORF45h n=1 Tax=Pinus koraiensis TaxID=88728 RepID=A4QMD9_PINKO|nr:ORF45h [Pinus koraiensis]ABP35476.1 ORF45h [Pinus koraiensis]